MSVWESDCPGNVRYPIGLSVDAQKQAKYIKTTTRKNRKLPSSNS